MAERERLQTDLKAKMDNSEAESDRVKTLEARLSQTMQQKESAV
jgi:hypothetical protein